MIEWVPGNQEVRDSSRSGPSEGTVRTNSQSLGKGQGSSYVDFKEVARPEFILRN